MTDPVLDLREVTRVHGTGEARVHALRGVSLTVSAGELVAVMGPSGSGKSTLLALAGGLDSPTEGEVIVEGAVLGALSRKELAGLRRRSLGYVFQDLNLIPALTAAENVMLPRELDGVSARTARVEAAGALEQVGIADLADRFPDDMSGGQQQRVAIARALIGDRAAPRIADALRATLPTSHVSIVRGEACRPDGSACANVQVVLPSERLCPADAARSVADARRLLKDPRCTHPMIFSGYVSLVIVDDGRDLPALTGVPATDGIAALRAGKAVVFDPRLVRGGMAVFEVSPPGADRAKSYRLPAVVLDGGFPITQAVVPPTVAARIGMHAVPTAVHAANRSAPTARQEQAARGALDKASGEASLIIERGYVDTFSIGLLALVIGAAIITLGAAVIATALSNVDSRPDLATLAAVG